MADGKPPFRFSQGFELISPEDEKAFGMPVSEWNFLRNKIDKIRSADDLFILVAFAFIGISANNGVLAIFTNIQANMKTYLWCLGVIATLVVSGLCFLFHFLRGKDIVNSKENVLEEMERIQKRYSKLDKS